MKNLFLLLCVASGLAQAQTISVSPKTATVAVGATKQLTRSATVVWASSDTSIATVSSTGLVTAKRAGTATISVTAGGPVARSTITVPGVIVTPPPPPPPPPTSGTGWRGHEPADLAVISEESFAILPSQGWRGYFNYDLASDATAPVSPSGVFENVYPAGMSGGVNPGLAELDFGNQKTVYVALYVKHSSNFQGHSTSVNKILHMWVGKSNHLFLNAEGSGSGALMSGFRLQGIAAGGNRDGGSAGVYVSPIELTRAQWHLLEIVAVANTGSNKDGSVTLYVDGIPAVTATGIEFEAGGPSWNLMKLDPTWGGTADQVRSAMSIRVDHIYVSGK